jgi:hypothetical protein
MPSVEKHYLVKRIPNKMDTTPPAVNVKCIIFTALLASGYWFLPSRNKWVLVALAYFPYLALAWYDWIYACQHNFGPTYLAHFYSWAKPQKSRQIQIYKNWDPKIKARVLSADIFIAGGLLLLVPSFLAWKPAKMSPDEEKRAKSRALGALFFVIAVFAVLRIYME